MANEIISYIEMCRREGASLQQGMNFFSDRDHSVILMSIQPNAPYRDRIEDDGGTLIYEGHDAPRRNGGPDPKRVDQPDTPHPERSLKMVASSRQPPPPKSKPGPRASFGCTRSCDRG